VLVTPDATPEPHEAPRGEGGFVAAWMALSLLVLVGMAGFATDLAYWYLTASRVQNAADAAALGGVVFLPGKLTEATSVANTIAGHHGYVSGQVAVAQAAKPNQLKVTVTKPVSTFFVKALGIDTVTVRRTAVAEYEQPVAMGSPDSNLGNDPETGVMPNYWLNIAGPQTDKSNGDRYTTKRCGASGANEFCTTVTTPNNAEFAPDGYFFGVKATAGQDLRVQLFDAAYVPVGDTCTASAMTATQLTQLVTWLGVGADLRYVSGLSNWCAGDQAMGSMKRVITTVLVREPDQTPWVDTDNPVVPGCTQTFPGFDLGGSNPTVFQYLNPSDGIQDAQAVVNPNDGVWTFVETYRRWATVCTIGSAVGGEYIVQVRTTAQSGNPAAYDASIDSGGHNRYSMRVGKAIAGDKVDGTGYVLYARGRFPIYANNGATQFKAARVLPGGIGRTLRLTLYDIGDATGSGTLYVTPSPDANISTFSGCLFSRSDGVPLSGANPSTCTVSGVVSSGFNGRIVNVDIPIPDSYTCNVASELGCWVNVRPDFTTASPRDTTTWAANMLGTPVRLVA
jgi:hypothetical protein